MTTKLTHSYTAIKKFEQCPLRYYRERVLKDVQDEMGEAAVYGDRIHKALEHRIKTGEMPEETARYEKLVRAFEALAGADGQIRAEEEFVITDRLAETDWWSSDAWIRSKFDVLILRGSRAVVGDWKTGARRQDMFQMDMYAAFVMHKYPEVEHVTAALVWLKTGEMDKKVYHRRDCNHLWMDILSRIRRIYDARDADNWPARPSGLCGWCPCRFDCEFATRK